MSVLAVIDRGLVYSPPPPPEPERPAWLDELLRHRPPMPFAIDPNGFGCACPLGCSGRWCLRTHLQGHGLNRAVAVAFDEIESAHVRRRMLAVDFDPAFDCDHAVEVAASLRRDLAPKSMPLELRVQADDRRRLFEATLLLVRLTLDSWPNVPATFMRPGWTARSPLRRRSR